MLTILRNASLTPPYIYWPEFESSFSFISRSFTSLHFIYLSFFFNPLGSLSFHESFYSVNPVSLMGRFNECPLIISLCWNSLSNQNQFILIQLSWIILRFEWLRSLKRVLFFCVWIVLAAYCFWALRTTRAPPSYPTWTLFFLHRLCYSWWCDCTNLYS